MIEYVMLIMLGFFAGGLIALLIAPTLWRRAVRLTTRRIEATMPMSLSDIEADKDMLRASYAIQIRRLETALEKAREKSAGQIVEISKLQMEIGTLQDQMAALQRLLDERSNAANVFEKTIKKRFPELDAQLGAARAALDERGVENADLRHKLARKEEALALVQQASTHQQSEIRQLREALEKTGADQTGRFKKRPAQWTLEEYRSEYDRLSLELSKMREQLALSQDREGHQVVVLKTEMQQLAEQIMTAVAGQEKHPITGGNNEPPRSGSSTRETAHRPQNLTSSERPHAAPRPWPKEQISLEKEQFPQKDVMLPLSSQKLPSVSDAPEVAAQPLNNVTLGRQELTKSTANAKTESSFTESISSNPRESILTRSATAVKHEEKSAPGKVFTRASLNAPAIMPEDGEPSKTETRAALKSLLDRGAKSFTKVDTDAGMPGLSAMFGAMETAAEVDGVSSVSIPSGPIPAGVTLASLMAQPEAPAPEHKPEAFVVDIEGTEPTAQEGQLDRMLREIFESSGSEAEASAGSNGGHPSVDDDTGDAAKAELMERLRVKRERHTG